ncbi:hypothetical protein Scep_009597 [Stephania cephalantha]|uniref:Uncharacterized protein n=1 Tax=Stephania cephalantha TaxID=152367 RepID=A0AAP0PGE8_9MAGN
MNNLSLHNSSSLSPEMNDFAVASSPMNEFAVAMMEDQLNNDQNTPNELVEASDDGLDNIMESIAGNLTEKESKEWHIYMIERTRFDGVMTQANLVAYYSKKSKDAYEKAMKRMNALLLELKDMIYDDYLEVVHYKQMEADLSTIIKDPDSCSPLRSENITFLAFGM